MLTFAELDKAASMAAQTAPLDDRDDVYQDAWVKFMRYPPQTFGAACVFARHARNDFWRTERRHRHAELLDMPRGDGDSTANDAINRALIAAVPREIVRLAVRIQGQPNGETGKERVQLHRWRVKFKGGKR